MADNMNNNAEACRFYCQVDTYIGVKDYLRGGRCVRLIGVQKEDYGRLFQGELNDGVSTFVLDLDLHDFLLKVTPQIWFMNSEQQGEELQRLEEMPIGERSWYCVEGRASEAGLSYFYPTFSNIGPQYFDVDTIEKVAEPALKAPEAHSTNHYQNLLGDEAHLLQAMAPVDVVVADDVRFSFAAFHVGQGMCSIAYNSRVGILFDAGAGKPVTRASYQGRSFHNQLKTLVADKRIPYLVLSHFDYDHWRMLAWDEVLRAKIEKIVVPDVTARSVAFFDTEVLSKVQKSNGFVLRLAPRERLVVRRSSPQVVDSNGECLISALRLVDRQALIPGDYVYARMRSDNRLAVRNLAKRTYAAVIVPHHGDTASAQNVPTPSSDAIAFFSAGTHKKYGHPKIESLLEHSKAGFSLREKKGESRIIKVRLL